MKHTFVLLGLLLAFLPCAAELPRHCGQDEARLAGIVERLKAEKRTRGENLALAASLLQGAGEDSYYMADSVGTLRVNLDSFSPLMFVNSVIALVKTADNPSGTDIAVFSRQLEDIVCRRGENHGFPSVMFHTSDWIGDNISRGNISELTEDYAGVVARTKSLDEMTRKRSDFAALADSAVFEQVRMTEMGFRTHRIPTLKKETVKKREVLEDLRDGDIILLVPNRDGIDMYDIGFVKMEEGVPHFIHLSPQTHTVVTEKDDLGRYMALVTKYFQGYRILRVKD